MNDNRIQLNGIKVHPFPSDSSLLEYVEEHKGILVAINAEKILHANEQIQNIVNRNIGYCDGIGAVMAVRQHGAVDAVKIAGCELWLKIITALYQKEKTFYLVGSKQPVIEKTISRLKEDFPGIQITGYRNGYIQTETEQEELIEDIKTKQPDVIFVAMGSPKQELLMEKMYQAHPAIYLNPAKRKANARQNEKRFSQQKRKVLLKLEVLPLFKAKAKRHSNGD